MSKRKMMKESMKLDIILVKLEALQPEIEDREVSELLKDGKTKLLKAYSRLKEL